MRPCRDFISAGTAVSRYTFEISTPKTTDTAMMATTHRSGVRQVEASDIFGMLTAQSTATGASVDGMDVYEGRSQQYGVNMTRDVFGAPALVFAIGIEGCCEGRGRGWRQQREQVVWGTNA